LKGFLLEDAIVAGVTVGGCSLEDATAAGGTVVGCSLDLYSNEKRKTRRRRVPAYAIN